MKVVLAHPICTLDGERAWVSDNRTTPACDACGRPMDHWTQPVPDAPGVVKHGPMS